jgi:hypothetical protein
MGKKKGPEKPPESVIPVPKPLPKREVTHSLGEEPNKKTSAEIAHLAGKALGDPTTPKELLGIIASDLAQAEGSNDGKPKKK